MFKRLEYPWICAQLFHASSGRIESICWSFEVEIKTADFYSLHKQRYCILHLFTCRVLAFSQFPVGTYIKTQTRNLRRGDAKITLYNVSSGFVKLMYYTWRVSEGCNWFKMFYLKLQLSATLHSQLRWSYIGLKSAYHYKKKPLLQHRLELSLATLYTPVPSADELVDMSSNASVWILPVRIRKIKAADADEPKLPIATGAWSSRSCVMFVCNRVM